MSTVRKSLEYRIRRLERANRLLTALVLVAVGAPWLIGAGRMPQPDTLTARRIQIVDSDGQVRIDLRHDAMETGLFVLDERGDTRLGAAQFAHGGGGYALHGPAGKGAAVLYLKGDGSLTVYDADGTATARFPESR